jgi:hypothetical protein
LSNFESQHPTVMACGPATAADESHAAAAIAEAVAPFGGRLAPHPDGRCLVSFDARENAAEQAVRAALALQAPAALRIGLHTAPTAEQASDIALHMLDAAGPGSVLISAAMQRATAGLFVVEDQGARRLLGVAEPMIVYRVVRATGRRGRLHGVAGRRPTPLVGRDEQLGMVRARWEMARRGTGQLVLLNGPDGLGKSRLAEEFRTRLADTPHTWIETGCGQLLQNTPFHPFAAYCIERFGGRDEAPEQRLAALEDSLAAAGIVPEQAVPLLAPMLDLPLPDRYLPSTATAEDQRQRLVALLAAWFLQSAKTQPLVLAFEDLHWADPSTLEVLKLMAERGGAMPVLLLMTARPQFRAPWQRHAHHAVIELPPLRKESVGGCRPTRPSPWRRAPAACRCSSKRCCACGRSRTTMPGRGPCRRA